MDPITIVTYALSILVVAIPIFYTYSKKLAYAMTYLYELLNIMSSYMKGDTDHEFTDEEKIDLADKVIVLGKRLDADIDLDAVLNFVKGLKK
jgi:hypothetical protein